MTLVEIIICGECGDEHYCYDDDIEGEFPCRCGVWLFYQPPTMEKNDE